MALTVKTVFKGVDKVTKVFSRMADGADNFGRRATRSFREASKGASRFSRITKSILASAALIVSFATLGQVIRTTGQEFIAFDQAAIGAASRFKDIGPDAIDFSKKLLEIRNSARAAGAATEFTASQSSEALNFLAKAGFTSAEAIGSLNSMINLATATGEDFATVADFSSDLLGAFGLNVDDTAQKIKNLARLNDVLVKAANTANVTVEDLFETMKIAAPVATGLGQSLESVTAVTAFLGGAGIKGSQAATALKNSFLNLASPSSKASKMLKALGVRVDDGTGNMRELNEIIGDLTPELDKMGNIKAAKILNEIFGKRAIAGAINIGKGTEAIREFEKSLLDAGGTAQRTADRMRESLGNRIKTLISAATEFSFKIFTAFEKEGAQAIGKFTEAIRNFDPKPIINAISIMVKIMSALFTVVEPFLPIMPILIKGWLLYTAAMNGILIAQRIQSFISFFLVLRKMIGTVAILNALLIANPIGAIIFGVTAAIALFILLEKKFQLFSNAWNFWKDLFISGLKFLDTKLLAFSEGLAKVASFFGILGPRGEAALAAKREAPNKEEIRSRQEISFRGQLDIAGAPEGSTVKSETRGAPDIDVALLGPA